jgi:hypothetical protein
MNAEGRPVGRLKTTNRTSARDVGRLKQRGEHEFPFRLCFGTPERRNRKRSIPKGQVQSSTLPSRDFQTKTRVQSVGRQPGVDSQNSRSNCSSNSSTDLDRSRSPSAPGTRRSHYRVLIPSQSWAFLCFWCAAGARKSEEGRIEASSDRIARELGIRRVVEEPIVKSRRMWMV